MNNWATLYRGESSKPVWQFVADLKEAGLRYGLLIHNEDHMEMAHTFGSHGVQVAEGFDLHMIQICKPEKAAGSLQKNPERAALMPKFVTVFTANGSTQVRFLRYTSGMIDTLVNDAEFAVSVGATYDEIEQAITESL
jgi:uncharacterized protein (DUF302 family)